MAYDNKFRSTIETLWARLRLGPPSFLEPGNVRLNVEGIALALTDNDRGSLVIEGVAASFSIDPTVRARQIRKVLETNMGLLLYNDAGVYMGRSASGAEVLSVRTSYPYSRQGLDQLIKKIEDTVGTIEYYSTELKSMLASNIRHGAHASTEHEATMVFTL